MEFRAIGMGLGFALTTALLAACQHNPYATKVSGIAYDLPEKQAAVTVSDPKLYRREALIEERKREAIYLNDLLGDSKNVKFTPEIIRDIQTVTALSAAVGLKFDPAAALSFKQQQASAARQQETADLQQQIDVTKLQLQLDQLKTDAAIFRKSLADQTAVSDNSLGKAPTSSSATQPASTPASGPAPSTTDAATQLTAAVDALKSSLQTTLAAPSTALSANSAGVSPIDSFRDMEAYRGLLKSAINAASLDELHDFDGSALMRLSFEATVLPPRPQTKVESDTEVFEQDYTRSLAFLRMKVLAPDWKEKGLVTRVYGEWLSHVNNSINYWRGDSYQADQSLLGLSRSGAMFDPIYYWYPRKLAGAGDQQPAEQGGKDPGNGPTKGKAKSAKAKTTSPPAAPPTPSPCKGLSFDPAPDGCGQLVLAAPRMVERDGSPVGATGMREAAAQLLFWINPTSARTEVEPQVCQSSVPFGPQAARAVVTLRDPARTFSGGCAPNDVIRAAAKLQFIIEHLTVLEVQAKALLVGQNLVLPDERAGLLETLSSAAPQAAVLVNEARSRNRSEAEVGVSVPARFEAIVTRRNARVSIYEVAPRELVQQVSTSARAGEAIGLAAALSGQLPSAGWGANGNIAYSRSATGRADARERAPLVVSFAEAHGVSPDATVSGATGDPASAAQEPKKKTAAGQGEKPTPAMGRDNTKPSFGWILGPPASLDPKSQQMVLEHRVKPYDLSVDLSVPGWWPYFDLETTSGWAPKWWKNPGDILADEDQAARKVRVQLAANSADMAALTNMLSGEAVVRVPFIRRVTPGSVSPCTGVQMRITGDYVWRASAVTIGGRAFGPDRLTLLPDLGGVLVNIDAQSIPALDSGPDSNGNGTVTVTALTPYGPASAPIDAKAVKGDGSCKTPDADPKPGPSKPDKTPTISDVDPLQFSTCTTDPIFRVVGDKLTEVVSATLGDVEGKLSRASKADAKALTITFPAKALRRSLTSIDTAPLTLKSSGGAFIRKDIAVKASDRCPG